jgi:hypothetical protein
VVGANTIYNISTKSTPSDVNAFASLATSYFIAMLGSVVMFFLTSDSKNLLVEVSKTNWSALALGIAIVGLEFGYICIYRAGWKIGVASLVANISLACVLLLSRCTIFKIYMYETDIFLFALGIGWSPRRSYGSNACNTSVRQGVASQDS